MSIWRTDVVSTWSIASGSPGVNTWFFRATDENALPETEDLQRAIDALETFYTRVSLTTPTAVTIKADGRWSAVSDDAEQDVVESDGWQQPGQAGDNYLPPANAILLRRLASTGGRSGKGRAFLSPLAPGAIDQTGRVASGIASGLVTAAQELIFEGPLNGAFVVWSRSEGIARDITSFSVAPDVAVLRSRRD